MRSTTAQRRKKTKVAFLLGLLSSFAIPTLHAETLYISDLLTVPLRSGPSNSHRILHQGLRAGLALEVLQRDSASGFVEIRTARGTQGWLREQYLVKQPIARDRLKAANARIQTLERTVNEQRQQLNELSEGRTSAERTSATLNQQVASLTQELEEIKRISQGAIEEHEQNLRMGELNARLRAELESVTSERDVLKDNAEQRRLMIGGGLVLLGLALGAVIKARPRRSAWS